MANSRSGNGGNQQRRQQDEQALMVVQPPRLPMPDDAAAFHGITATKWRALIDAIYPAATSVGGVMLALDYCKARNLDPFKRPVHVVPMYSTKLGRNIETVWPGIGELRTTASRTGSWAGNDDCVFGRILRQAFRETRQGTGNNGPYETTASCPEMDFPEWAQITVYKIVQGQRVPFVGPKVYFVETFSGEKGLRVPNVRWRQAPRQMLEKCAEAAALRRAFPEELAGELTAEEMEGQVIKGDVPVEAQYHYVDTGGDAGAGDQQQVVEQQSEPQPEQQRDLRGWNPERLAHYMDTMRAAMAGFRSLDMLDEALAKERGKMATLPDDEAREARELETAARDRLDAQDQTAGDGQRPDDLAETPDTRGHEPEPEAEPLQDKGQTTDSPAEEEPPFVRNFRRRVAEIELIVDLDRLERVEKRAIDQMSGAVARACDRILVDRRAALQPR